MVYRPTTSNTKVKTTVNDMAFLCVLSVGYAIQRGKAELLSIEKRRRCGQSSSESPFHIRTSARMGENIISCFLYFLPLKVSLGKCGDMGSAAGGRPNKVSYGIGDIIGRDGFPTRGRGCLHRSSPNSQTWWQVYWRIKCESGVLPISCGE